MKRSSRVASSTSLATTSPAPRCSSSNAQNPSIVPMSRQRMPVSDDGHGSRLAVGRRSQPPGVTRPGATSIVCHQSSSATRARAISPSVVAIRWRSYKPVDRFCPNRYATSSELVAGSSGSTPNVSAARSHRRCRCGSVDGGRCCCEAGAASGSPRVRLPAAGGRAVCVLSLEVHPASRTLAALLPHRTHIWPPQRMASRKTRPMKCPVWGRQSDIPLLPCSAVSARPPRPSADARSGRRAGV